MKILSVLIPAGLLLGMAYSQQPPPAEGQEPEPPPIKVEVDVVNILCSVRDKRGALIPNLAKEDFTIIEDGKQQSIRYFTQETDLPLTIGLLVDVSRSQENLIDIERTAASQFFSSVLQKKDSAFLISFGSEAELLQDYTSSVALLREGLNGLRVNADVGGLHPGPVPTASQPRGTILYDAVYLAAKEKLQGEVGRKAVVLITDGVDQGSRVKLAEAIEAAHKADAIIYSIYYSDPSAYGWYYHPDDRDLKKMSEETGGRLFRVQKKHPLPEIFDEIQREMRSQYAIGYSPTNPVKDGTFRRIEIKMRNKDMKAQARKGYYAIKPAD